jgi:hypothetical protein
MTERLKERERVIFRFTLGFFARLNPATVRFNGCSGRQLAAILQRHEKRRRAFFSGLFELPSNAEVKALKTQ